MTYFGFLVLFLGPPLLIIALLTWRDQVRHRSIPADFRNWAPWFAIVAHVVAALLYTTPWDNYLVATGVWFYNPDLVSGIVLGWVPLEEYCFFVLQTVLTGLWVVYLIRHLKPVPALSSNYGRQRWAALGLLSLVWLGMAAILVTGWAPGTYLALELTWGLIPVMVQIGFGGDILWRHWRIVLLGIIPPALYLSAADAVAITAGTWTIDPAQSLQIFLGGILPIEEFVFFLLTNTLVTLGMLLVMAVQSQERVESWWRQRRPAGLTTGSKNVKRQMS